MTLLQRLQELTPWEMIAEEDLFLVDGLYLSVRGQVLGTPAIWVTDDQAQAQAWTVDSSSSPGSQTWVMDARSGRFSTGDGQALNPSALERLELTLERALDSFERKPVQGLQFPVWFNLG